MSEYTLEQARREIAALNDNVVAHLNRIGALEAMVREFLHHMPTEALESMATTYDVQTTLAMAKLAPSFQREQLWTHFQDTLSEIVATRKGAGRPSVHPEK